MKKLFYLAFFCVVYGNTGAQTQSIIYDATAIMNAKHSVNALLIPQAVGFDVINLKTGKLDAARTNVLPNTLLNADQSDGVIYQILRRNANLPANATDNEIRLAYQSNPFLKDLFSQARATEVNPDLLKTVQHFNFSEAAGGGLQNILGNVVNGTADFLIKRAQEELSISVFEKFKTFILKYPEFDTLFPQTCALIKPVEPYEYNKALAAFKAAINEDLQHLVSRISLLYSIPRYQLLNQKVPALTLLFSGTTLLSTLHGESDFASSINVLGQKPFLSEKNNYASFVKLISLLSNSFLDKSLADEETKKPVYINKEYIKLVTHDNPVLLAYLSKIYLGLIWQQTQNIQFTTGNTRQSFSAILGSRNIDAAIVDAEKTFTQTFTIIRDLEEKLKQAKLQDAQTTAFTGKNTTLGNRFIYYTGLVNAAIGLTDLYIDSASAAGIRLREIQKYLPVFTGSLNEMIKDFQGGEYNLGLSKLEEVLTAVSDYLDKTEKDKTAADNLIGSFQTDLAAQKTNIENAIKVLQQKIKSLPPANVDAEINANIESEKQELSQTITRLDDDLKKLVYQKENSKEFLFTLPKILKYMNMMAAISKAENSQAIETILETYALPAGSSRIKKVTSFNIAVNAYVGGFAGRKVDNGDGFSNSYGLTAPIGFTISTGFKNAGSLSAFIGILDIGGTIRYKLDNQGKYQQDISIAGIISPGIHIVYGFPWYLPLSVGIGNQWISPTSSAGNEIKLKQTFNAFFAVDIPLFNLQSKPYARSMR